MNPIKHRLFILGAGFSKPAGYPLASELWKEILNRTQFLQDRGKKFHDDLESYIEYKHNCEGKDITVGEVDLEDFMRFLDVEHFLGLRGSDTWSSDGNEGTVVVKSLIGQILAEATPSHEEIPNLYLKFARLLQPFDIVLTFNYDILIERALEAIGMPYRLFPHRYKSTNEFVATIDDSRQEVTVLKLHGSIDWFDKGAYTESEKYRQGYGLTSSSYHPVFSNTAELDVTKLIDDPGHSDDPLNQMYRVQDIKSLYQKRLLFLATPWLLAPSMLKILYSDKLRDFWWGLGGIGVLKFGLAIVGYSLPIQDEYARQIIYNLVTNYQGTYWGEEINGRVKSPLVIVDYCENPGQLEKFKNRYKFVDWNRAILYTEGLNEKSIDLIFRD